MEHRDVFALGKVEKVGWADIHQSLLQKTAQKTREGLCETLSIHPTAPLREKKCTKATKPPHSSFVHDLGGLGCSHAQKGTRLWMSVLFPTKFKTGIRPEGWEGEGRSCQAAEPGQAREGEQPRASTELHPWMASAKKEEPPHPQNTPQTAKVGREGNNKTQSRDNRNTLQKSIKTLVSPGDTNPQETRLLVPIFMHITEITSNCSRKIPREVLS